MRLFRAIMNAESAEEAVQMVLARYPHSDAHMCSPSAVAATPSSPPASLPVPAVDFSSMTLAELKSEMSRRGLKAQSKAGMVRSHTSTRERISESIGRMEFRSFLISLVWHVLCVQIAKLQQIAALSPVSSLPHAAESDSSDESDADEAPIHRAGKAAAKKRSASSKSLARVHSFLHTYLSKVHARYHPNRAEMELVLQSYLRPNLHPSVETLEKKLHTRM